VVTRKGVIVVRFVAGGRSWPRAPLMAPSNCGTCWRRSERKTAWKGKECRAKLGDGSVAANAAGVFPGRVASFHGFHQRGRSPRLAHGFGSLQRRWHLDPDTSPLPAGLREEGKSRSPAWPFRRGTAHWRWRASSSQLDCGDEPRRAMEHCRKPTDRRLSRSGSPVLLARRSVAGHGGIEPRTLQVTNLIDGRGWGTRLDGTQLRVDAVVFSPDGRLLAAACEGELVLYEATSGRTWATLTRSRDSFEINALAFAPDGRRWPSAGLVHKSSCGMSRAENCPPNCRVIWPGS